jgi:hypothetical protein
LLDLSAGVVNFLDILDANEVPRCKLFSSLL